jgi:hypothetical protein
VLKAVLLCFCVLVQEVKSGDAARVRSLLARVTSLALPPKKMKGFFRLVVQPCESIPLSKGSL